MLASDAALFGISVSEVVVLFVAIGYVVSLAKDWRPMRTLRIENSELREALALAQKRIDELESKVQKLSRATDLTVLQREHTKIIEVLDSLVTEVKSLDGDVKATTAAIEVLSKRKIIDEALSEPGKAA